MNLQRRMIAFLLCTGVVSLNAQTIVPHVVPLWPHGTPEPVQTAKPERDMLAGKTAPNGLPNAQITNITSPTMTIYPPPAAVKNAGAAALVFPGGGYKFLAINHTGTEDCDWLNSLGMTCLLVKYRVPEATAYPENFADLEDAQQAMRIARAHAAEWHVDPARIGIIGSSAGAHLAVVLSSHPDDKHILTTPAASDVPSTQGTPLDARAAFAIICWPAYLAIAPEERSLKPELAPNGFTSPTFIIQAEDDPFANNAIVYYRALMDAKKPAQLHYYATGKHGFGMHPKGLPQENWPDLAATWLRSIRIIP